MQAFLSLIIQRKVRTPKSNVAGNTRHPKWIGIVQQKVCTGNAVVESCKLCMVKRQVNLHFKIARFK